MKNAKTTPKKAVKKAATTSKKTVAASKKSAARSMDFEKFLEAAFSDSECKKMARAQIIKTAIRLLKADEKAAAKIAAQVDVAFPKIEVAFKG